MKRLFDIIISAICLVVFSPLFLIIYLTIKIGGGPAIYRQERIGLGGRPFFIYKFRSMVVDAEDEGAELLQQENDPRLTRIGRFLRSHHLDELPQLWNVFRGDMAFVGPRPERKYYIDQIMQRDPRYQRLYVLRPGVTSYATLKNGYADNIDKMLVRLRMDLYYLEHQSMWTDMKILMRTFLNIVSGRMFILVSCLFCSQLAAAETLLAVADDTLSTTLNYTLTAETAVGTGNHTAYQLVTNRHHILSVRPNTAYVRGGVTLRHPFSSDLSLSACLDGVASVHADHKAYLQQCYVNLSYKSFFVEIGSREEPQVVRDDLLSVGSFVKGTNAKPIPQVHLGTNGFWTLPFTRQWVQINFDFGYGKFLDSSYREQLYLDNPTNNDMYTTGALYHQKHLYIRTNPAKLFFVMVGIEHAVQFGGACHRRIDGRMVTITKPESLKAFWNVILPLGDANYFENNAGEDWVYGNHIGVMTYQLGWNVTPDHQLQAYLDNPFEDGSGVRKGNGWDGLWGLQYSNRSTGRQYVRGAVFEYFQSTNQGGPLHWDSADYPEPIRSQIDAFVVGNDNYYNHSFYDSYSHYGMTPGIALITSPRYNADGYSAFCDNRVKAWHLGINGEITDHLSYLVKGSYREGWGTYYNPLPVRHHSFDAMFQASYQLGSCLISTAYAFDKGNIYGDCSTFNFKIQYHGKLF